MWDNVEKKRYLWPSLLPPKANSVETRGEFSFDMHFHTLRLCERHLLELTKR